MTGIRRAAGSWSVQTHLGSQTRFSCTSHHFLLFLISVTLAKVLRTWYSGAIPMAVGTESCLHQPRILGTCPWIPGCRKSPANKHVSLARPCKLRAQQRVPEARPSLFGVLLLHLRTSAAVSPGPERPALTTHLPARRPAPAAPAQVLGRCPIRVSSRLRRALRI